MLTTTEHIKQVRSIASNISESRLSPYIKEVEDFYIMPAIGAELYEKLDKQEANDDILLDGGYYDNSDGSRGFCHGIYTAVAYFAYAKILLNNQINVTAFGVTQKSSTLSTPTSDATIKDTAAEAKKMGHMYLDSCIAYLNAKRECKCGDCKRKHFINMEVLK